MAMTVRTRNKEVEAANGLIESGLKETGGEQKKDLRTILTKSEGRSYCVLAFVVTGQAHQVRNGKVDAPECHVMQPVSWAHGSWPIRRVG
jgi:hypothetical protein